MDAIIVATTTAVLLLAVVVAFTVADDMHACMGACCRSLECDVRTYVRLRTHRKMGIKRIHSFLKPRVTREVHLLRAAV